MPRYAIASVTDEGEDLQLTYEVVANEEIALENALLEQRGIRSSLGSRNQGESFENFCCRMFLVDVRIIKVSE